MADIETHTVNEAEFSASSRVGDFRLDVDASGEEGPTPNEVLLANYASCYSFAMRAEADHDLDLDLGRVETEAEADLDEDDHLEAVQFTVHVEADLDDEQVEAVLAGGENRCHIHAALREELAADITVEADAF